MNLTNDIIDHKYQILDKIGEGGTSLVFTALDLSSQTKVAVKILKEKVTSSFLEDFIRFQREIEIISKLTSPYIIKVYAAGEYRNHPYIVTEYLEGESLAERLQNSQTPPSIETTVEVIKQITEALCYIHHHGVVHRDLKPGNIFLIQKSQIHIKLLDFGVAYLMELAEIKEEGEIAGTFGYMSPEASGILNRRVDERSDLYSLGVIFYRLLTGEPPFPDKEVSRLLHSQAAVIPPRPSRICQQIPTVLDEMVMKLLEKDPDLRFQSAFGLLSALKKYQQGEREFDTGAGDRKIKLSYQTRLVGRDEELKKIKKLVDQASQGKGGICLIAGEAGIGKSRLVEEVGGYVNGRNGLFIRGRCLNHDNKTPYQPFKDALDEFLRGFWHHYQAESAVSQVQRLKELLGDLGGILIQLNPRMEQLIGTQKPLIPLEPERETQRFLMVVADFFSHLADRTGLCALFLDDLQWADEGSLNLLQELGPGIAMTNLIVFGAYREHEVGPGQGFEKALCRLRTKACELTEVKLESFGRESLRELVTTLLGATLESVAGLDQFIFERSSGNPFFTIHLVREIIENEALKWQEGAWKIDWDKLNRIPVSGNMVALILNRIAHLTEAQTELLCKAAIIGREFEIELLAKLTDTNRITLVGLVDEMLALQLLEKSSERGRFLFAHDRIRDAFYQKMTVGARRKIHHEVARIMEENYQAKEVIIYELVHHYLEAGELEKTLEFILPAADLAKASYANEEAIKYYQKTIELLEQKGRKGSREWIKASGDLAGVYLTAGRNNEAIAIAEYLLPLLKQPMEKAGIYKKIGQAYFKKGDWVNCKENSSQGLLLLGVKVPRTKPVLLLYLLRELMFHWFLNRIWRPFQPQIRETEVERYREIIWTYYALDYMYIFTDVGKFLYNTLKMLNISKMKLNGGKELALSLAGYGMIFTTIPWFKRAFSYYQKALSIGNKLGDEWVIAQTLHAIGRAWAWKGMNLKSITYYESSIQKYRAIGDIWELAIVIQGLALTYLNLADYPKALQCYEQYFEISSKINDDFGIVSGESDMGYIQIEIGNLGKAQELLDKALASCEEKGNLYIYCCALIYYSYLELERENYDQAITKSEAAQKIDEANLFVREYTVMLYSYRAEAYLKKYQTGFRGEGYRTEAKELGVIKKLCYLALRKTRLWANQYGRALRVTANYYALVHKNKSAQRCFLQSMRQTRKTGRRFELAKTCFEYGQFLHSINEWEESREHWRKAYELFSEIGAAGYLKKFDHLPGLEGLSGQYPESRERLGFERRMNTVLATSQYISSILEMDDLLQKIIDSAMELTGAERGILLLYPETGPRRLEPGMIRNVSDQEFHGDHFGASRSIIARIETERRPLLIVDAMSDEEFQKQTSVFLSGIRSALAAPMMVKEELLGVIYLDNRLLSGLFDDKDLQVLGVIANQAGVSIENARLYRRIQQYSREIERSRDEISRWNQTLEQRVLDRTEQLEAANRELMTYVPIAEELAAARERNRIAGDVHDTLGHTLSLLVNLMETSRSICKSNPEETERFLMEGVKIAREGLSEARRSVAGLFWDEGAMLDFIDSIEKLITDFQFSGVKVNFVADETLPYFSRRYAETLYRLCQEGLTNSLKHGRATEANIFLKFADQKVKLFILDNGCGCSNLNFNYGFGLRGMRQRVESLKGRIVFGSGGGRGFNIHVEIPMEGGVE